MKRIHDVGLVRKKRRRKLMEEPFPPAWEDVIRSNMAHYCLLDDTERRHLRELISVFITEKFWGRLWRTGAYG